MPAQINKAELLETADLVQNNGGNVTVHLVKSSFTPLLTTTLSSMLAIEADFSGYAAQVVAELSVAWDATHNVAVLTYDVATFTHDTGSTPNNIYGYFITRVVSSVAELVFVGTFSPAYIMANNGDQITVQPILDYSQ